LEELDLSENHIKMVGAMAQGGEKNGSTVTSLGNAAIIFILDVFGSVLRHVSTIPLEKCTLSLLSFACLITGSSGGVRDVSHNLHAFFSHKAMI
jgi:hypothetical protein